MDMTKPIKMSSPDTLIVSLSGGSASHAPPCLTSMFWALSRDPSEKPTYRLDINEATLHVWSNITCTNNKFLKEDCVCIHVTMLYNGTVDNGLVLLKKQCLILLSNAPHTLH